MESDLRDIAERIVAATEATEALLGPIGMGWIGDAAALARAHLAAPDWHDRPTADGLYLKCREGKTIFAQAVVVVQAKHLADPDGWRWFGPIPGDTRPSQE